jgi:hypothetical protein
MPKVASLHLCTFKVDRSKLLNSQFVKFKKEPGMGKTTILRFFSKKSGETFGF